VDRDYLTVADGEILHALVLEHSGGSAGVRDRALLESAVFRPQSGYYADVIEETAALIESLTNNHPFVDGNKRTALLAADVFLNYNGYTLEVEPTETNEFFLSNLRKGTFRFPVIQEWLRKGVRPHGRKKG
jgi:death-on-curing protein